MYSIARNLHQTSLFLSSSRKTSSPSSSPTTSCFVESVLLRLERETTCCIRKPRYVFASLSPSPSPLAFLSIPRVPIQSESAHRQCLFSPRWRRRPKKWRMRSLHSLPPSPSTTTKEEKELSRRLALEGFSDYVHRKGGRGGGVDVGVGAKAMQREGGGRGPLEAINTPICILGRGRGEKKSRSAIRFLARGRKEKSLLHSLNGGPLNAASPTSSKGDLYCESGGVPLVTTRFLQLLPH